MRSKQVVGLLLGTAVLTMTVWGTARQSLHAEDAKAGKPGQESVARGRRTAMMLDEVYKNAIVLITDKYVHDEEDFPAGSAAVVLFDRVTKGGSHAVRLIDATGKPYDEDNVAKDEFEKAAVSKLKAGAETVEQVVQQGDKWNLRVMTPVPVVMKKCVMCHAHYADAKKGEPIGAISYTIPLD